MRITLVNSDDGKISIGYVCEIAGVNMAGANTMGADVTGATMAGDACAWV